MPYLVVLLDRILWTLWKPMDFIGWLRNLCFNGSKGIPISGLGILSRLWYGGHHWLSKIQSHWNLIETTVGLEVMKEVTREGEGGTGRRWGGEKEEEEKHWVLINIRIGVMLLFRLVYEPGELNSLMQRSDSLIPEIFNVASPQRQK